MKKVILLGDSIRLIGYGKKVPALLGDEYTVWQPSDNCRFAQYTLRGLFDWRNEIAQSDVIHWNNGLWDVCDLFGDGPFTKPEVYVDNMLRIAGILKNNSKKVIFATTTPVNSTHQYNKNETIEYYNSLIVPKLADMGIIINDLYALVSQNIDEYIRQDDKIHLTDVGIDLCANAVADCIKKAL
jgi:hypothetical protein